VDSFRCGFSGGGAVQSLRSFCLKTGGPFCVKKRKIHRPGAADYQKILQAISPILALLSEKRASAIRQYLKYRLHYLKSAMG
jgi:hypothetical protein